MERYLKGARYLGTVTVKGEYAPVAVYRAYRPDRSLGHKKYVLAQVLDGRVMIRGMHPHEFKPYRIVNAVRCPKCNHVVASCMRHEQRWCECGAVGIDGGRDYIKTSYTDAPPELVRVDILTGLVIDVVS